MDQKIEWAKAIPIRERSSTPVPYTQLPAHGTGLGLGCRSPPEKKKKKNNKKQQQEQNKKKKKKKTTTT
ncbi:hypothetical protein, partial [Helicobacter pylori]|uniref:hypothetical protein n=1 Tax=Helicobacter pylori TaxID=210 RepID=UPI0036F3D4D0